MYLLSIGIILLIFTILVVSILMIIFRLTGWDERNYSVCSDSDEITFFDHTQTIREIAIQYKPIVCQLSNLRGPVPEMIFYEVLRNHSQDQNLTIIYRVYWPDEIHPNWVFDKIYRLFRWCYYGTKIDLEYIQIVFNNSDISGIQFESDSSGKSDIAISDHITVNLKRKNSKEKEKWIIETPVNEKSVIAVNFEQNTHFQIRVLTWNHLFTIKKDISICERYDLPLKKLANENYRNWKIKRRSNPKS